MPYSVKILADSLAPSSKRLTTWQLTYPRFVHAELMTHRLFSRNSASSRAIPTAKLMEQVKNDPAMPVWWGKNQPGMQAREELSANDQEVAKTQWLAARNDALYHVEKLGGVGLHKQIANRLLEPWMFITVIMSATEHENWFRLRCHPDAQPEIGWVAQAMKLQYDENIPQCLDVGEWHRPLITFDDEVTIPEWSTSQRRQKLNQISVARCARVSYLTHDGRRDYAEDIALHDRLAASGHWSPFEHVAQALAEPTWSGNFCGWKQYRENVDPTFTRVGR